MKKKTEALKRRLVLSVDDDVYREIKIVSAVELKNPAKIVTEAWKFWMNKRGKK